MQAIIFLTQSKSKQVSSLRRVKLKIGK